MENITINKDDIELIKNSVKKIPDFPKPGILFYDIFSILSNVELTQKLFNLCEALIRNFISNGKEINAIVGLESRGFLIGLILADRMKLPFVPIRKKNKLPGQILKVNYYTEYSEDTFELQDGVLNENSKVLIVDDLLATGGTLNAAENLVKMAKASLTGYFVVFDCEFLKGRSKISKPDDLLALITI